MKILKTLAVALVCAGLAGPASALTTTLREGYNGYSMNAVGIRTDSSANQDGYGLYAGVSGSNQYASLVEWDFSSLPANQVVESLSMSLYASGSFSSNVVTIGLYQYDAGFSESSAKWSNVNWSAVGADPLSTLAFVSNSTGTKTFGSSDAFVTAANEAIANDEPLRLMMKRISGTYANFYSDDNFPPNRPAWAPALTVVTADAPPVPEPATMAAVVMGFGGLGGYIRKRRKA